MTYSVVSAIELTVGLAKALLSTEVCRPLLQKEARRGSAVPRYSGLSREHVEAELRPQG